MIASQVDISKAQSISGWMSDDELTWLALHAQDCETIVEFGSYMGRSTRALADNTNGKIYAVDPWNGDYYLENEELLKTVNTYVMPHFLKNLKDHIESGKVIPIRAFSSGFKLNQKVDMVFLDGDHRYKSVIDDINTALSLLKPGGIIAGHDYGFPTWPGVKRAVDEMLMDVWTVDTIWWTRKY